MGAPWVIHVAAVGLVVLDTAVRAWRIRLLLPRSQRPSVWRAVAVNAYGDAASAITPARFGGDPARFLGFRRSGVDSTAAVVALGVEALIDWVLLIVASGVLAVAFGGLAVRGAREALRSLTSAALLPWLLLVLILVALSGLAAHWYRKRHPGQLGTSLKEAWGHVRSMRRGTLAVAGALTAISMMAQVAILPLLLVPVMPAVNMGGAVLGSFTLLYGQLFLPTPAGVGGVELGFVVGLGPALAPIAIARLLLAWRIYTIVLGALLGAVLFLRQTLSKRTAVLPATSER